MDTKEVNTIVDHIKFDLLILGVITEVLSDPYDECSPNDGE